MESGPDVLGEDEVDEAAAADDDDDGGPLHAAMLMERIALGRVPGPVAVCDPASSAAGGRDGLITYSAGAVTFELGISEAPFSLESCSAGVSGSKEREVTEVVSGVAFVIGCVAVAAANGQSTVK